MEPFRSPAGDRTWVPGRLVYWSALGVCYSASVYFLSVIFIWTFNECLCLLSLGGILSHSLLLRRLGALGHDARSWPLDTAGQVLLQLKYFFLQTDVLFCVRQETTFHDTSSGIKFNYRDDVDDMLLLWVRAIEVVGADNDDGGGGGAPLDYLHYVVRV